MEQSKMLKISWILCAATQIWGIANSAVSTIRPRDYFCSDRYEDYTGQSWAEHVAEQPKQAALYEWTCRATACAWLWGAVYALYITLTGYRRGEKRAWIILLLGTILLIGLVTVQLLRASGCEVLGVDTNGERLAFAERLGAETVDVAASNYSDEEKSE